MNVRSVFRFLVCLGLCLAIGFVGSRFTITEIPTWYAGLNKPSWTPPPAVFPIVWTALYILMAISLWRLWDRTPPSSIRIQAIQLFLLQLALNAVWTPVFFGMHATVLALAIMALLLIAIVCTIIVARHADRPAAWLLVPYLAWVAYASTLNAGVVVLN
jgi:tryptophan-rich sensory protein